MKDVCGAPKNILEKAKLNVPETYNAEHQHLADDGHWMRLEAEETVGDAAREGGVSEERIWKDRRNSDWHNRRKMPWWLGCGDVIFVPRKEAGEDPDKHDEFCHHYVLDPHYKIIDVYLGFMDEEVNARLERLVASQKSKKDDARPVILIERDQVKPDEPILEWRLKTYQIGDAGTPIRKILQVSPKSPIRVFEGGELKSRREEEKEPEPSETRSLSVQAPPHVLWYQRPKLWKLATPKYYRKKQLKDTAKAQKEHAAPEDILAQAMAVFMESDMSSDLDWLARGLPVKRYFDIIKLLQHQRKHEKAKTKVALPATGYRAPGDEEEEPEPTGPADEEGPWLSVVRFDVGDEKNAPIIVIRTPEMGLQPSLMSPYIAFLFKAISATSSQLAAESARATKVGKDRLASGKVWEWPIRVSEFGAQGSSFPVHTPGTLVTVMASLFVGVQIASDVTVTAEEDGETTKFTYKPACDSTEASPHRQAKDANARWKKFRDEARYRDSDERTEDGKKKYPYGKPPKDVDAEHYHKYGGFKLGGTSNAYAVISLCTPAGVYEFFRVSIHDFKTMFRPPEEAEDSYYKKFYKLLSSEYPKALAAALEPEKTEDVSATRLMAYLRGPPKPAEGIMETIERAEDLAATVFQTEKCRDALKLQRKTIAEDSPFADIEKKIISECEAAGISLKTLIAKVNKYYGEGHKEKGLGRFAKKSGRPATVTLTVSYFGGDADKKAADALGIQGVNMEDYHVLRVLRSAIATGASADSDYPLVYDWRIDRIDCDPREIEPELISAFKEFAKTPEACLTAEGYVMVIIWGLRGLLRRDLEASPELKATLKWGFPEKLGGLKERQPYFWSYVETKEAVTDETFWVPDPFCVELATDFISELKKSPPGIEGSEKGNEPWITIRRLAFAVAKAWRNNDRNKQTFGKAYDKGKSPTAQAAMALVKHLAVKCGFAHDGAAKEEEVEPKSLIKMWLRPGKWPGVNGATLQKAAKTFGGAAVDRAFYKSSNMMALQTYADLFTWEPEIKAKYPRTEGKFKS